MTGTETKIFDPADGFSPITNVYVATDPSVVKRGNRWLMYLAGKVVDAPGIQLFSASLPEGAPLTAGGWKLITEANDPTKVALLAPQDVSAPWDLQGGRHCPAYVRGFDSERGEWVERLYYAGGADNPGGPYTIGYLEWNGSHWVQQPAPAFAGNEPWERGSVFEPNLIYADDVWKMWYVAGSNADEYLVQGYAESPDGRTHWTNRKIVFPAAQKVFDFCVARIGRRYEAVFSRLPSAEGTPSAEAGLWWCHADSPSAEMADWSQPVQIMTADDKEWHRGPWKPSLQQSERNPAGRLIFFAGLRSPGAPGWSPYAFTLGCLEIVAPE